MKSLHTVQSMMKVLKILSKIGLVFCIVGTVLSLIGGTVMVALEQNADDEIVAAFLDVVADYDISVREAYTAAFASAIICSFSAYLEFATCQYFKNELEDGTPFTYRGAGELRKLGIKNIVVPIVSSICVGILYAVLDFEVSVTNQYSLAYGIGLILLSLIFRYGADLEGNRMSENELEPEVRN